MSHTLYRNPSRHTLSHVVNLITFTIHAFRLSVNIGGPLYTPYVRVFSTRSVVRHSQKEYCRFMRFEQEPSLIDRLAPEPTASPESSRSTRHEAGFLMMTFDGQKMVPLSSEETELFWKGYESGEELEILLPAVD